MAQTKQERATMRQRNLEQQRQRRLIQEGFDLIEAERGVEVQCMTCLRTWKRLGATHKDQHRMICPPDPELSRFLVARPEQRARLLLHAPEAPAPIRLPLPLRRTPW